MSYKLKYLKYKNKYLKLKEHLGGTLDKLIIPNTTIDIGDKEYYQKGLTELTIPDSVKTIGNEAFFENKLNKLLIPDSVKTIGNEAFSNNRLIELIIGNSVETIGHEAFSYNLLTKLKIPNSVITIVAWAFSNNRLIELIIGNSVKTIGNAAFCENKLKTLIIPNSVETIGGTAFYSNYLMTLTIGNKVKTIGELAFANNYIMTLIIPNSVETIGKRAFSQNPLIEIITYNPQFNNLDKIHFITGINKDKIIIDKIRKSAPYTIKIVEMFDISYITSNALSVHIEWTIKDKKRINNFIDQLYDNLQFKRLINNYEDRSLYIILIQIITYSDGTIGEKRDDVIDLGGATSFMFNNLFDELTEGTNAYFKYIDNYYILNDQILVGKSEKEKTELKKKIEFIGKLFAYALELKQTIDIQLHPLLLYKMLFGIDAQLQEFKINYLINNFDVNISEFPFGCFIKPDILSCKYDIDNSLELTNIEMIYKNAIEHINTSESYNNELLKSFVTGFRKRIGFNDKNYKCISLVSTLSESISGKNKMWSLDELERNLVFENADESSKDNFFTIINKVITEELINRGELKGDSITEQMYNETENETIQLWIRLFIQLLTNRKKIPIDEFKDKKLTISIIYEDKLIVKPYLVHTCFHKMDIYMSDIKKLGKSVLYEGLKINNMKAQLDDIGLS
jgi:hypothetical protein